MNGNVTLSCNKYKIYYIIASKNDTKSIISN